VSVLVRAIDAHDDPEVQRYYEFQVEHGTPRHTVEELRAFIPTIYDVLLLVADDEETGELLGCAAANLGTESERGIAMTNLFALPGRSDVLRALIERITAWTSIPKLEHFYCHLSNPADQARADLEAAGMRFANDRYRVRRVLTEADRDIEVDVADGIELTSMAEHPELEDALIDLWNESITDIPTALTYPVASRDEVREHLQVEDGAWPERIRIAVTRDDELLGFCALLPSSTPGVATFGHRLTATARAARGRGLATTLKLDAIRWAARQGATELFGSNDSANAPMRAVNQKLGYEVLFTIAVYELPLD
jgi:RimJ/RimL family protein N-acetyltransferase